MKIRLVFVFCLGAATMMSANVLAQSTDHPTRPPDSFGQAGNQPDTLSQRPVESYGQQGQRPAYGGSQRPADSYGQHGQRPNNAPQRPAGSFGHRGGR